MKYKHIEFVNNNDVFYCQVYVKNKILRFDVIYWVQILNFGLVSQLKNTYIEYFPGVIQFSGLWVIYRVSIYINNIIVVLIIS